MKKTLLIINALALVLLLAVTLTGCSFLSHLSGLDNDAPLTRKDGTGNAYVTGGKSLNPPTAAPDDGSSEDPYQIPQIGGAEWPDNEYTKQVPKPDFKLLAVSLDEEDESFTAAFMNATAEEVKAYAEKVKEAGFTVDPELQDETVMGMTIYSYTASNGNGYTVTVSFTASTGAASLRS